MKKILFIGVTSQNFINFRHSLIMFLKQKGYEISVVAFDEVYAREIESWGCRFFCVKGSNRSLNVFRMLALKKQYKKIIKQEKPDAVITCMMKPNIFGVKAAKAAGIPNIYAMVEGVGDVFINNTLKWKLLRFAVSHLYKSSFKHCKKVILSNGDDKNEFLSRGLAKEEQLIAINEPGVDLQKFEFTSIKNNNTFLMIARMLKTKGVIEYCQAARKVKKQYPEAIFNYIGAEGTITLKDIQEYIMDGTINYCGVQKDIRAHVENSTVNVLPSYREGLGMVNLETAAMGRMSITCNTNGTKDTVKDRYSGFLIPVRDVDSLVEKMIWCIEHPDDVISMGKNARCYCEENFDVNIINEKIIQVIEDNFSEESTYV